ncbi:hypothetical protein BAE44_0011356, partial [Dichanthelium oligosanthes]
MYICSCPRTWGKSTLPNFLPSGSRLLTVKLSS